MARMTLAKIDQDDDAVFDAVKTHSNHEEGGYCCPHCLNDNNDPPHSIGDDKTAVVCSHCSETFVIWNETEIRQCSGKLADS